MKKRRKKKSGFKNAKTNKPIGKPEAEAVAVGANFLKAGNATFIVTRNLLHNLVVRDAEAVQQSFDRHYRSQLSGIDDLFSEAAFLFFVVTRTDTGLHDNYKKVLTGLLNNALNTFGASVILLRNGLPGQSMVLIRQVIEMCSTIIHISGDPKGQAIKDFEAGKYGSTTSIALAKMAVPIIGMFWGFLSKAYVHINQSHSEIQPVRPYEADDADVKAVLSCLRMSVWICYITAELAFPTARERNRYWQLRHIDGKNAVAYEPDKNEREWAAKFLDLDEVGPDDLGEGGDDGESD
jgi:hypothetical protein